MMESRAFRINRITTEKARVDGFCKGLNDMDEDDSIDVGVDNHIVVE